MTSQTRLQVSQEFITLVTVFIHIYVTTFLLAANSIFNDLAPIYMSCNTAQIFIEIVEKEQSMPSAQILSLVLPPASMTGWPGSSKICGNYPPPGLSTF